ncbi:MAG: hypothetical protein HKM00_09970 [Gallionella sp.]|nr:hypothetical protein [Gallionella sp.]
MFRLPMVIVYMIVALNFTLFTLLLQLDMLMFHFLIAKVIAWLLSVGAWVLAYKKRDKFVTLF